MSLPNSLQNPNMSFPTLGVSEMC